MCNPAIAVVQCQCTVHSARTLVTPGTKTRRSLGGTLNLFRGLVQCVECTCSVTCTPVLKNAVALRQGTPWERIKHRTLVPLGTKARPSLGGTLNLFRGLVPTWEVKRTYADARPGLEPQVPDAEDRRPAPAPDCFPQIRTPRHRRWTH